MPPHNHSNLLSAPGAHLITGDTNRLHGTIAAVWKNEQMARVDIVCGPYRVVSLMAREAADELGLKTGDPADAIVRRSEVVIERV